MKACDISEVTEELLKVCAETKDDEVTCQFNVLDQMHANENAHTRVLVNLLAIPFVCKSFFDYMRNVKKLNLPSVSEDDGISASCFGDYIDGRIEMGSGTDKRLVIIENKVKGAIDQEGQIDRYSRSAAGQVSDANNVYVIYLTKEGGRPSENSFRKAKSLLDYKGRKNPGRFVEMNYRDHILDWLQNGLLLSQTQIESQPLLASGISQYVHYIQGPELLDCRISGDVHQTLKNRLREILSPLAGEDIAAVGASLMEKKSRFLSNAGRGNASFAGCPEEMRVCALKRLFYSANGEAIADNEFNRPILITENGKSPVAKVSLNRWTSASLVQIDLYCDADCDGAAYVKFAKNVSSLCAASSVYEWDDRPAYRYDISLAADVLSVVLAVKGSVAKTDSSKMECKEWCLGEKLSVVEECLSKELERHVGKGDVKKWDCLGINGVTIGSDYRRQKWNDWHLQLVENFGEGDFYRSIELFPTRQCETLSKMHGLVEGITDGFPYLCEKWDGRLVYRFPVESKKAAEDLCSRLLDLIDSVYDVTARREMVNAVRNLVKDKGCRSQCRIVYVSGERQIDVKNDSDRELGRPWLACGIPVTFHHPHIGVDVACFACILEQDGTYEVGLRRLPESENPFEGKGDESWWLQWDEKRGMSKYASSLKDALKHLQSVLTDKKVRWN